MTSLLLVVGCTTGQGEASNYGDTEEAFLEGCQSIAASDNEAIDAGGTGRASETRITDPTGFCGCVFDEVRENIPFAEFKRINSELRDEGGPLPSEFRGAFASCAPSSSTSSG